MKTLTASFCITMTLLMQAYVVYAERVNCRIRADGVQECIYQGLKDDRGKPIGYDLRTRADGTEEITTSYGDRVTCRTKADGTEECLGHN